MTSSRKSAQLDRDIEEFLERERPNKPRAQISALAYPGKGVPLPGGHRQFLFAPRLSSDHSAAADVNFARVKSEAARACRGVGAAAAHAGAAIANDVAADSLEAASTPGSGEAAERFRQAAEYHRRESGGAKPNMTFAHPRGDRYRPK